MSTEKTRLTDTVKAVLGKVTVKPHWVNPFARTTDKIGARANVHVVLTGSDGVVKYDEWGENLVTDVGDGHIAKRVIEGDTEDIVTGMKLGNDSATPEAKNGAGAAMVEYISGSEEALDAPPTEATKGAGAGWRATFVVTWAAGDVTDADIEEVCLTNQTALADNTSAEADTIARFLFASTIDKQAGDSLEVTWQIDVLGA